MAARQSIRWTSSAIIMLAVLAITPAQAQSVADFYRGKTVSLIVGGSPGGGYDTVARTIARFIGQYMPGNPTFVVQNMPGAGGTRAMNHLYSVAAKDGSVIGLVENNTPLAPLFGTKEARYDATKFDWLGTPSVETGLVIVWHTVPVNGIDDMRTRVTTMGAPGVHSTPAFYARLLNATLGTKMKVVPGYRGMNDIFIAMERGEVEGHPSPFYSSLVSTRPSWLKDKLVKVLVQYGAEPLKELPNVPFALDLMKDPQDKQMFQAASATLVLGRPLVAPPQTPPDRLAALRKALADTFADHTFQSEATKIGLVLNGSRTGEQLQDVIAKAYAAPPAVIERLRNLINAAGN